LSKVKRQHYVPQFLLKKFSNQDEKIHVFERNKGFSHIASSQNVACQRYYNAETLESGDIDTQSIEKRLSEIEGAGSVVMELLLSGSPLTSEQREDFAIFLTSQDFRSPRKRQDYADLLLAIAHKKFPKHTISSVENYIEEVKKASSERGQLDLKNIAESKLEIDDDGAILVDFKETVSTLSAAQHFAPIVSKMNWEIIFAPAELQYVISDSPVQLFEDRGTLGEFTGPGYWRPESCISFPLSPNACFLAYHPKETSGIGWPPKLTSRDAKGCEVRFLNQLQLVGCLKQVYASSNQSWLGKKCALLPEAKPRLSFLPVDQEGEIVSVKTTR